MVNVITKKILNKNITFQRYSRNAHIKYIKNIKIDLKKFGKPYQI